MLGYLFLFLGSWEVYNRFLGLVSTAAPAQGAAGWRIADDEVHGLGTWTKDSSELYSYLKLVATLLLPLKSW